MDVARGAAERAASASSREPSTPEHSAFEVTLAARLSLVEQIAEHLAATRDLKDVAEVVARRVTEDLGAMGVNVELVDENAATLHTVAMYGLSPQSQSVLSTPRRIVALPPSSTVVAEAHAVYWSSVSERDERFPELRGFPTNGQAWALLPLIVHDEVIGVLSLGWRDERRFGAADAALLRVVAQQCAVALDRARLETRQRRERETLELLNEGTRLMVSALEPERIVAELVRLAVPRIAPWGAVYVAEGEVLRRVVVEFEGEGDVAAAMQSAPPVPISAETDVARAYRTGARVVAGVSADSIRAQYGDERAEGYTRRGWSWTALLVPISARGEVIGVLSLASPAWGPVPPPEAVFTAEGLAGRAGVALSNARRYQQERRTAALLTEALLPPTIPSVPGYEVTARYLPAGGRVAGDWFDVARLPSGRYLLGVGDAGGHGMTAASLMAQLRNAARGIAIGGRPAQEVLGGLRLLTLEHGEQSFATAMYALLDTTDSVLCWASAGHFPPLVLRDGAVGFAPGEIDPPLAWPRRELPAEHCLGLAPGDVVVLVTDGVVERRGAILDEGFDSLREVVLARAAAADVDTIADAIVEGLCGDAEDDCCVVVLRRLS